MISHKDLLGIIATAAAEGCAVKPKPPETKAHVIEGRRLAVLISNAHRLLGTKYRRSPLWALVSDLTGHGATISSEICTQAGYDPCQPCGPIKLKSLSSGVEAAQSLESLSGNNKARCDTGEENAEP